jgi:ABC-type antimicrobial peptide transport system permease subunit
MDHEEGRLRLEGILMTTKIAVIASVVSVVAAMVIGLVITFLFAGTTSQNAQMIGQGMGMLTLVPLLVIWVLWADRFRKEREKRRGR